MNYMCPKPHGGEEVKRQLFGPLFTKTNEGPKIDGARLKSSRKKIINKYRET